MAERWYREGLCFECTRCGICCTGAPGHVWVTWEESRGLAGAVGLDLAEFRRRHLRRVGSRYSLTEKPNGDCVFWDRAAGCTVYRARPAQCRTYPFWPENVRTRVAWEGVMEECPGAGRGRLYSIDEIEIMRRGEAETGGNGGAC
jgi:hypothetical protein